MWGFLKSRRINSILKSLEDHERDLGTEEEKVKSLVSQLSRLHNNKIRTLNLNEKGTKKNLKQTKQTLLHIISRQRIFLNKLVNLILKIDEELLILARDLRQFLTDNQSVLLKLSNYEIQNIKHYVHGYLEIIEKQEEKITAAVLDTGIKKDTSDAWAEEHVLNLLKNLNHEIIDRIISDQKLLREKIEEIQLAKTIHDAFIEKVKQIELAIDSLKKDKAIFTRGIQTDWGRLTKNSLYLCLRDEYSNNISSGFKHCVSMLKKLSPLLAQMQETITELKSNEHFDIVERIFPHSSKYWEGRFASFNQGHTNFLTSYDELRQSYEAYISGNQRMIQRHQPPFMIKDVTGKHRVIFHSVSPLEYDKNTGSWALNYNHVPPKEYVDRIIDIKRTGIIASARYHQTASDSLFKANYFFENLNFRYGPLTIAVDARAFAVFEGWVKDDEITLKELLVFAPTITDSQGKFKFYFHTPKNSTQGGYWHDQVLELLRKEGIEFQIVDS